MRGERRNREERGWKLLPFTITLHNFTFSLAAHGSERKTTRSLSSGVRLACEISAITPQKKERPCRLLSQMLWILFFLITADPQLTDTLSLSVPSHPPPPAPHPSSCPYHIPTLHTFFLADSPKQASLSTFLAPRVSTTGVTTVVGFFLKSR